jgi:hypothetical protein
MKEQAMQGFKHAVLGTVAVVAIACAPIATAGAHGFGHLRPWGVGRGLLGAVVGLATLPLAIASAALSATEPEAPYQSSPGYDGSRSYAPPPAYYAAPQTYYAPPRTYYAPAQAYYAPPRAFYPRAPVYSSAPRTYYAPHAYYAPRPGYYGGHASYRAGGYAYPRR